VRPCVVVQENDAFSEHSAPFVLDRPPKLIQRFTIDLWRYCGPWCHEFYQQISLTVPEYCSHHFFVRECLNFLSFLGECVCIHCLECFWSLHSWTVPKSRHQSRFCQEIRPPLPSNAEETSRLTPFFEFCESQSVFFFWYPLCTELTVTQSARDNFIKSSPRSLWKFFRKFQYRETFSTHALVDFLKEFISHNWVSSLTTFVMHISAPIPEFSAPFSHKTVTHNIFTISTTQLTVNLGHALSFCVKKMNHRRYLTAGGSGDDSVHVSSVITPTVRSKNVWG